MNLQKLVAVGALSLAMLLWGCSSHVVRCDGKLSPINAPAPANKTTAPVESTP